jgi:hypothetical protein
MAEKLDECDLLRFPKHWALCLFTWQLDVKSLDKVVGVAMKPVGRLLPLLRLQARDKSSAPRIVGVRQDIIMDKMEISTKTVMLPGSESVCYQVAVREGT